MQQWQGVVSAYLMKKHDRLDPLKEANKQQLNREGEKKINSFALFFSCIFFFLFLESLPPKCCQEEFYPESVGQEVRGNADWDLMIPRAPPEPAGQAG